MRPSIRPAGAYTPRRPETLRFGAFELDEAVRELRNGGARVALQEQPFRLLLVLLASPGELVTREQLRADLWPGDVFVDFEHGLNTAVRRLREALGDTAEHPRFVETHPRRGYRFIAPVERQAARGPRRTSVAVLPFLNLTPEIENSCLADGMTEDLITELARVSALRVVSRTSSMAFKGRERNVREVGQLLRVQAVVEGSVRRTADRIRIAVRIVDAHTDEPLWAETYDRPAADVLSVQREVAQQVAAALAPGLSAAERGRIGSPGTSDAQAYHLYLQGRHCLFQFTERGLRQAIDLFRRAADRDPSYALPHTGIAMVHMILGMGHGAGTVPQEQAREDGRAAIERALALDPLLGEAHGADACLKFMVDFDWDGAERAFARALELAPGSAETFGNYALYLSALGRFDEALAAQRRAHDLDPLAPVLMSDMASTLLRAGRYDEAAAQARELLSIEPTFPMAHSTLAWAHIKKGLHAEGVRELEEAVRLSPDNTLFLAQLGQAYAMTGARAKAQQTLLRLRSQSRDRYVSPYHLAYVYTGLGETETAIDLLERAVQERTGGVYGIRGSFLFTELRDHPRFRALLGRMNLPPRD